MPLAREPIVRTKIVNPTNATQRYSWVPKYGIYLAPGQAQIIDGDIYTLNVQYPSYRKSIQADIDSGRVVVTIQTSFETERIAQLNAERPAAVPVVMDVPATTPPPPPAPKIEPPKAEAAKPVVPEAKPADKHKEESDLGKGLVEDVEDKKYFDPTTGAEFKDVSPAPQDMEKTLWGDREDAAVPEVPAAAAAPSDVYSRKDLLRLDRSKLVDIASSRNVPVAADTSKSKLINIILESQGGDRA